MENKNIVSIEDRIPKLKEIRRRKANRRLIFYLSIFFILIGLIIYLQSPLSHIKQINVLGNEIVSAEEVIEQSELTNETNIWSMKQNRVIDLLEKHPFIHTAEVKRKLPATVEININEHKRVGYVKNDHEYFLLLDNGQLINKDDIQISQAPLIVDFKEDMYSSLAEQLSQLPKSILQLISEIHWQRDAEIDNKIFLYMNDGFTVNASLRSFAEQMKAYPSIVSQLDEETLGMIYLGLDAYFEPYSDK